MSPSNRARAIALHVFGAPHEQLETAVRDTVIEAVLEAVDEVRVKAFDDALDALLATMREQVKRRRERSSPSDPRAPRS